MSDFFVSPQELMGRQGWDKPDPDLGLGLRGACPRVAGGGALGLLPPLLLPGLPQSICQLTPSPIIHNSLHWTWPQPLLLRWATPSQYITPSPDNVDWALCK